MKKSQKFWMAIYAISLTAIWFIYSIVFWVIIIIGSILAILIIGQNDKNRDKLIDEHFSWLMLMPSTWVIFILGLFLIGCKKIASLIRNFNNKLDN